jgi:hypothetical protein
MATVYNSVTKENASDSCKPNAHLDSFGITAIHRNKPICCRVAQRVKPSIVLATVACVFPGNNILN